MRKGQEAPLVIQYASDLLYNEPKSHIWKKMQIVPYLNRNTQPEFSKYHVLRHDITITHKKEASEGIAISTSSEHTKEEISSLF